MVSNISAQCQIFMGAVAHIFQCQIAQCLWADERHGVLYKEVLSPVIPNLLSQDTIFYKILILFTNYCYHSLSKMHGSCYDLDASLEAWSPVWCYWGSGIFERWSLVEGNYVVALTLRGE